MARPILLGDLYQRADGGFDGWCWSPDRPGDKLIVELLVNDMVATSMKAAIFRRDLMDNGYGDGHHGFLLRLPPNLPQLAEECLITARERDSGGVFGRLLRPGRAAGPVGGARLEQADGAVAELWQGYARARQHVRRAPVSTRLQAAFGALGARLAAGPRATPPVLPRPFGGQGIPVGPKLVLPEIASPALSVVLPVRNVVAALRQIAALAAAVGPVGAEIIAVDVGHDPFAALLPARVRNLRYLRLAQARGTADTVNTAATYARGARIAVLGASPEQPSAAALLALARICAAHPRGLLLGPAAVEACARVEAPVRRPLARLPARLDLSFCLPRAEWDALGPLDATVQDGAALECADLMFRARLLGVPVLAVDEPAANMAAPVAYAPLPPSAVRRAMAAFFERWGVGADALDRARQDA
jgi:hypothetical protein